MAVKKSNQKSPLEILDEQMFAARQQVKEEILQKIADGRSISTIVSGRVISISRQASDNVKFFGRALNLSSDSPQALPKAAGDDERKSAARRYAVASTANQ